MPTVQVKQRQLDARPDRIDLRDLTYRAPLVPLEPEYPHPELIEAHLPSYSADGMILNQGQEGACTGFGLAACINYLNWERWLVAGAQGAPPIKVSTRMLYHMARLYDEWPGEDYDGSSCRGAMKGWHRHGVCSEALWPYRKRFVEPGEGWQQNAASRPLGAYYRINKDSIVDMQAAIQEVHAIYVSAAVHAGWWLNASDSLPVIGMKEKAGGHAFALVGYNADGFIVQNSWGEDWGYKGFAVMTYADWVVNGMDAWVAVTGAPVAARSVPVAINRESLQHQAVALGTEQQRAGAQHPHKYKKPEVAPWSGDEAYQHSLVLGNDGEPLQRLVGTENAAANVVDVAFNKPRAWLAAQDKKRLVIYAHGGLNNEADSIGRIQIMAPYFKANGIYPLFITWRTGVLESLMGIFADQLKDLGLASDEGPAQGWLDDLRDGFRRARDSLGEAKDRAFEAAAEKVVGKPVWTQMKQNAAAAESTGGGLRQLAAQLDALRDDLGKGLEIHLLGHSAGSILHGHLCRRLVSRKIDIASLGLYAPACTMRFATDFIGAALKARRLARTRVYFELLSDRRERDDSVGPYGKSLLYLVSRALEDVHKTPLLGLASAWERDDPGDVVNQRRKRDVAAWLKLWRNGPKPNIHDRRQIHDGQGHVPIAHGSFDNDVDVVTRSIAMILGIPIDRDGKPEKKLDFPIENLRGF
ncbi:MAG: C1 family peptidase [Pseudomonadota bacterium]